MKVVNKINRRSGWWVLIVGALLFACGKTADTDGRSTDLGGETDTPSSSDGGSDTDSESDSLPDAGPVNDDCVSSLDRSDDALFGQMDQGLFVTLFPDLGRMDGGVLSGPPFSFHQEVDRVGQCRLLTYEGDACDEDCAWSGLQCFNGECVGDVSIFIDAGPLLLRDGNGFGRTVSPTAVLSYYYEDNALAFADNDWVSIALELEGQPVSLETCVPAPLDPNPPLDDVAAAWQAGEDLVLTWNTVEPNARIYLHMTTGIGSHGGISPVDIECEGPDRGILTIPAAFLTALDCEPYCWSCGECGYHNFVRYHTDETEVSGKVVRLNNIQQSGFLFRPDR